MDQINDFPVTQIVSMVCSTAIIIVFILGMFGAFERKEK